MSEKAILVSLVTGRVNPYEAEESLEELCRLASTAGAQVIDIVVQRRHRPDPAFFVGKGKVEEIARGVIDSGATVVIFDHGLSPSQAFKIKEAAGCRVIDRSELIMDIFALHARTAEAKIQVEMAQLQYRFSRLVGAGLQMSDPGGGIGTRGPGEKQLELDRRKIKNRISALKKELKKVEVQRQTQRKSRSRMFKVALVGYTNAGKSTLMNLLSKAGVKVEDRLFATLDATTRQVVLASGHKFLLTDTVGFIRRLPHQLVASFKATLEEVAEADLMLHLVDTPHRARQEEMDAVHAVLKELKIDRPEILVFNKIDKLDGKTLNELKWSNPRALFISALEGKGRKEMEQAIAEQMMGNS
ncbi:GTPase HflX [candidate division TA06 bacterium]|uniref:GTPase HflX n=1 Tax=candidate division TA06 bacterium TaxID=2250710 RepID=A0A933MKT1_UNCT6|nr:GTPase HflX [candidate division TA06 bacterium]